MTYDLSQIPFPPGFVETYKFPSKDYSYPVYQRLMKWLYEDPDNNGAIYHSRVPGIDGRFVIAMVTNKEKQKDLEDLAQYRTEVPLETLSVLWMRHLMREALGGEPRKEYHYGDEGMPSNHITLT